LSLQTIAKASESKQIAEVSKFNNRFDKVALNMQTLINERIINNNLSGLQFDATWQTIMRDSGYNTIVSDFVDNSYDVVYKDIAKAFNSVGFSITFTEEDLINIEALKRVDLEYFTGLSADAGNTIKRNLLKYELANLNVAELTTNISRDLQGTNLDRYARTYAETAISVFNQSVIDMKAQDTSEGVWIYVGVNDGKTRDFCKGLLLKRDYYNDASKIQIQNDSRRRWNCRHQLYKIPKESAVADGYKIGSF